MKHGKHDRHVTMVGSLLVIFLTVAVVSGWAQSDAGAPSVAFTCPANLSSDGAQIVPPTVNLGFTASDPDADSYRPARFRFLLKEARDSYGNWIRLPYEYEQNYLELVTWDDPDWSDWSDYPGDVSAVQLSFPALANEAYYVVAVQVMDADGAVSLGRGYNQEVAHIWVRDGYWVPDVYLYETFLGQAYASISYTDIASGQPLNFSWSASAETYCGEVVSYRYGWDLIDPNDTNDPGWAVLPGLTPEHLYAPEQSFTEGVHRFHLRVVDDSDQTRDFAWVLSVVPFVDPEFQKSLLVIDQVIDRDVYTWPSQDGLPLDNEIYRNAYWHFLAEGTGGVADFSWEDDFVDHLDPTAVSLAQLVNYKVVLCFARSGVGQRMFEEFRPHQGQDRFVWLTPYQTGGGNLFLVGGNSMDSFLEDLSNYMVPLVFENPTETFLLGGQEYVVGFGTKTLPDGSEVPRGPLQYQYATAGIAALDWTSVSDKYIYNRTDRLRFDREADCVGLKGLTLDPNFAANHAVAAGALPDTFYTDASIDWYDVAAIADGTLTLDSNLFPFRMDEFVDANISDGTPYVINPQRCDGAEYPADLPNGMCVEPMFRGIARFDWLREHRWAEGEIDWPTSRYTSADLEEACGELALASYQGVPLTAARTNGKVFGYMSYKMVPDKQRGPLADVYWGFDPYRFDHEKTKQAIRWVLDYMGLNINP